MARYAENTKVSVADSKAEIERILARYDADQFLSGWTANQAVIGFTMEGRQIRFVLTMPPKDDGEFTTYTRGRVEYTREPHVAAELWEKACRQRWRALALVIKAKLEAVESGISVFEDEFMANIVMPGGQTVSDMARPRIAAAYAGEGVGNLLPDYSGGKK